MGDIRGLHPVGQLLAAFEEEKIGVILIGMSAAIIQGVMGSTLDVDLWIDLPPRQYMRVQNIARRAGATVAANTVVYLANGIPVNFVYEVTGLESFRREYPHTRRMTFHGRRIRVLRLERIQRSKEVIKRDKDLLHIQQIEAFLRCQRALRRARGRKPASGKPKRRER